MNETVFNETAFNSFSGSQTVYEALYRLADRYPSLSIVQIGLSSMNRPILALGLGRGPRKALLSAAFHANEWLTALVLTRYIEEICSRQDLQYILENNTLCFVPLVNPDGVDLVAGQLAGSPYYNIAAAIGNNYPNVPFPSGWKANIMGTDLNLQYDAGWERAKDLKYAAGWTSPAPRDFVGDFPAQAPEARAMVYLAGNFNPDALLALHSQGEVIYYMYNGYAPGGTLPLGNAMAEASGYLLERTPSFSDNAGYKDWFIASFDKPGFTVEMGRGQNPLPLSQLDEIYARCAPMFTVFARGY